MALLEPPPASPALPQKEMGFHPGIKPAKNRSPLAPSLVADIAG